MDNTNPEMATPKGRNLTAKTIIGDDVRNSQGEILGTVQDLMLDLDSGNVAYVVLSHGGVLGVGGKLFAVPWKAFGLDPLNRLLVLDVDKDTLKNAEGFDKDDWPNTADPTWRRGVDEYYGVKVITEPHQPL
jgi:sporulation protein YlmC with PRC-barrel domain